MVRRVEHLHAELQSVCFSLKRKSFIAEKSTFHVGGSDQAVAAAVAELAGHHVAKRLADEIAVRMSDRPATGLTPATQCKRFECGKPAPMPAESHESGLIDVPLWIVVIVLTCQPPMT